MRLSCRGISRGVGRGKVLLSEEPISFLGGVDPSTGDLTDQAMGRRSVRGRVLAFPRGKGSTVGSYVLMEMRRSGTLPAAIINASAEPIVAAGAIMAGVPMVDRVDLSLLRDGDECIVDGTRGEVELPEVREAQVVTCIVQEGDRILLLRRSEKVGTFKGRWAGVSGFIEEGETPLQTARKELQEEIGLSGVEPSATGGEVRVRSEGTVFVVHPFLFKVRERRAEIDWEHTELRWVLPAEVADYQTVPGLDRVLRSVGL